MNGEIPGAGQADAMVSPAPLGELSPRQESRMQGFETLVERIAVFQEKIANGERWEYYIKDEQGNQTGAIPIPLRLGRKQLFTCVRILKVILLWRNEQKER